MMPGRSYVGVRSREGPLNAPSGGVARLLPRIDIAIRHAPIETLSVKDADFDFRQVHPAGTLRGVMKDRAVQQVEARCRRQSPSVILPTRPIILRHGSLRLFSAAGGSSRG